MRSGAVNASSKIFRLHPVTSLSIVANPARVRAATPQVNKMTSRLCFDHPDPERSDQDNEQDDEQPPVHDAVN